MEKETAITSQTKSTQKWILTLGIIFIALNLRPSITSVGPLIRSIRTDFDLSNGLAGLLTTLPLLAFAILSPLAPKMGHRLGNERTVFIGLLILIVGIVIRSLGWVSALFVGMTLIGMGVAVCNVLLPGIIKHRFPLHVGLMTSIYSTLMGLCASLASGFSVPLAFHFHFGWKKALLFWGILAIVGAMIWAPQWRFRPRAADLHGTSASRNPLWRSPLAWQVTLFMGLQSLLYYSMVTWLPEILRHNGMEISSAGWMLSLMQFVGLPASFVAPVLADRYAHQKGIVICISSLYFAGLAGLLIGGNSIILTIWVVLLGLGQGASISLSLTFLSIRAQNAEQASELSGMAQSIGYLMAATGPILIGFLFDQTHAWVMPLALLLFVTLIMNAAGLGAGRNQYVLAPQEGE